MSSQTRKLRLKDLYWADIHVELVNVMLTEVTDTEAAMSVMNTVNWTQFSEEDLEQSRLTSSIGTDLHDDKTARSNWDKFTLCTLYVLLRIVL